jgi:hypothetical protein
VNKSGSNAVYVVLAVALILAASASAAPVQPTSALLACTAAQLSLCFKNETGNFTGRPKSHLIVLSVANRSNTELRRNLNRTSGKVVNSRRYLSHASTGISFRACVLRTAAAGCPYAPSGQDAKYSFAYLKRDQVYVRLRA